MITFQVRLSEKNVQQLRGTWNPNWFEKMLFIRLMHGGTHAPHLHEVCAYAFSVAATVIWAVGGFK